MGTSRWPAGDPIPVARFPRRTLLHLEIVGLFLHRRYVPPPHGRRTGATKRLVWRACSQILWIRRDSRGTRHSGRRRLQRAFGSFREIGARLSLVLDSRAGHLSVARFEPNARFCTFASASRVRMPRAGPQAGDSEFTTWQRVGLREAQGRPVPSVVKGQRTAACQGIISVFTKRPSDLFMTMDCIYSGLT
jgi:hypothetical protein